MKRQRLLSMLEEPEQEKEEIQIIPMIDIMLFLLTFFILYTLNVFPMLFQNLKLPTSSTLETAQLKEVLKVYITKDGDIETENVGKGIQALRSYLKGITQKDQLVVVIVADRDSKAQRLMNVMDVLKEEGISRIAIAGEKKMNVGLKRERLFTLFSSFVFSSFSAVAVALLFSRLTLYSLPETPQQVVEVISLPILEQRPQSPPQQRKVEKQAQREPKREKIERKTQEKSPQQPPKAQEQKLKEEPRRETPVQESPVAQEVKPLTTQEASTIETPREEKRIIGGETQRQEVATREKVESPPQVQEKKSTPSPPADQLSRYFALVKGIIESKKRYPEEAKRRREEGAVVVSFTIDESGNPVNVRLASSSGSSSIDNETLRLIRSLKFLPPPDGKPLNLRVEVEYQLRR